LEIFLAESELGVIRKSTDFYKKTLIIGAKEQLKHAQD